MARVLSACLLLLLAMPLGLAADPELGFDDPAMNERYRTLLHEVRCPKCLNTSIAESDALIATDLRREVHQKMAEGYTDKEIVDYLVSRYGEFVVYRPPFQPSTWALWGAPGALLLIGAIVFARILKDRARQPLDEDPIS